MITIHEETLCNEPTVSDLVQAAQGGDSAAFGLLVDRYWASIHAHARKMVSRETEAEDLVQDVFLRAFQKLGQLHTPAAFGGWLKTILRHAAINRAARRGLVVHCQPESLEAICTDREDRDAEARREEIAAGIHHGLSQLGEVDRSTLQAHYIEGMSLEDMSSTFAVPVGTIKSRLHTARKRLAQRIEALQAV